MLEVAKEYPARGPIQQFRLREPRAFVCFRCHAAKKSRLLTVFGGDWDRLLCNGCYGRLLALYEITKATVAEDLESAKVADVLREFASEEEARRGLALSKLAKSRTELLSPAARRFLGTSEYVARSLAGRTDLDWSGAVLGLCKTVEVEFLMRLIDPLRASLESRDLSADVEDMQYGRIARYYVGKAPPPELGAISTFLATAAHSKRRAASSETLQTLRRKVADWPYSTWLFADEGAIGGLNDLTSFRNKAAHLGELTSANYEDCFDLVAGDGGLLWRLVQATQPRREIERAERGLMRH